MQREVDGDSGDFGEEFGLWEAYVRAGSATRYVESRYTILSIICWDGGYSLSTEPEYTSPTILPRVSDITLSADRPPMELAPNCIHRL
jgi:hypothetical protein